MFVLWIGQFGHQRGWFTLSKLQNRIRFFGEHRLISNSDNAGEELTNCAWRLSQNCPKHTHSKAPADSSQRAPFNPVTSLCDLRTINGDTGHIAITSALPVSIPGAGHDESSWLMRFKTGLRGPKCPDRRFSYSRKHKIKMKGGRENGGKINRSSNW